MKYGKIHCRQVDHQQKDRCVMTRFFFDVWEIGVRCSRDKVTIYSAYAALFLIIAVFPFLMLLLGLIQYVPIPQDLLLRSIAKVIPQQFMEMVEHIINELMSQSSGTVVSVTAVTAIWASSRGVMGLLYGINAVYHTTDDRNWLVMRSVSILYTVMFLILIIATLLLLVFGNQLVAFVEQFFPFLYDFTVGVIFMRAAIIITALTAFFTLVYHVFPNRPSHFFSHLPGALFSAMGWMVFSYAFSYYVNHFGNYASMYGSLTVIVLLILWLYFCMNIIFIGGEINAFLIDRKK